MHPAVRGILGRRITGVVEVFSHYSRIYLAFEDGSSASASPPSGNALPPARATRGSSGTRSASRRPAAGAC